MRRVGPLLWMAVLLAGSFATGGAGVPGAPGDPPLSERPSPSVAEPVWPEAAGVEHVPAPVVPSDGAAPARLAFTLVSPDRMLADLSALTAIGQDALFRTSGTSGEREAFDLVASRLSGFSHLAALGATVERVPFRVPLASEVHEASLSLRVAGSWVDVPAHALQGHRDDLSRALRFDSDGRAGDDRPDPVTAEGSPYFVQQPGALYALPAGSMQGRVLFADYALLDRGVVSAAEATQAAVALLATRPAALVLVTRYSNVRGEAHGSFVGDLSALVSLLDPPPVPTLYARLEDLGPAGITDWAGLERVASARVTWDQDVNVAAPSQLLAFRIPGADPSRAVLLGAHLDSWDGGTGALDNGVNVALAVDVARGLVETGLVPRRSVRVVLFTGEEQGIRGSAAFVRARLAELDRVAALVVFDLGAGRTWGLFANRHARLAALAGAALSVHPDFRRTVLLEKVYAGTDVLPFLAEGVPCLVAMQDLTRYALLRHTEGDVLPEVDLAQARRNAALAAVLVRGLAESREPVAGRVSGEALARVLRELPPEGGPSRDSVSSRGNVGGTAPPPR